MKYENMVPGRFLSRPNRFIAMVEMDGKEEVCHVKNTGRCRELLPYGATVYCRYDDNPKRKTQYDLITVQKGERLINMDSQAPNVAAKEWLLAGGLGEIEELRSEVTHGDSRFDFSFRKDGKQQNPAAVFFRIFCMRKPFSNQKTKDREGQSSYFSQQKVSRYFLSVPRKKREAEKIQFGIQNLHTVINEHGNDRNQFQCASTQYFEFIKV